MKKTPLEAYSRPLEGGIIAIKLREGDALVDVVVAKPGDELVLATAHGMAIRFKQSDARPMGRNSSGVKGIRLVGDDQVVGMVVADPEATLLTACANGYGKRTPFGPNLEAEFGDELPEDDEDSDRSCRSRTDGRGSRASRTTEGDRRGRGEFSAVLSHATPRRQGPSRHQDHRAQRPGGRHRPVSDGDELLMMTAHGKIQRIAAGDVSIIGRNTQGVKIMSLDDGDTLVAVKRVPKEEEKEENGKGEEA